mgnify:FL=1|jgi:hypothetical protein
MKFLADIEVEQGADTTFVDNAKALFGNSSDLQIYHDGNDSFITDTGTGGLSIRGSRIQLQKADGTGYIDCISNAVELKNNGTTKLTTTNTGVTVTGGWVTDGVSVATANIEHLDSVKALFGNGNDLQIYHDGSNSYVRDVGTGRLWIDSNGEGVSIISDGSGSTAMAHFYKDAAVELYYNNVKRIETTSVGATLTGDLTVSGGDITLGGTGRIQGVDTVSASTDAANKAYVDAVNVGVTQITAGTNITISPVGGTGNVTINASGGGGSGTIGGSTTATEIAFGSSTASEIDSSPGLTYTTQGGLLVKNTAGGGSSKITMRKGTSGNCLFEMQEENPIGTYSAKFFVDLNTSEDTEITATGNLTLQNKVGTTKDIILNPTANLGIGTTTPESKLQVAGGIQMGTDGAADDIAAKAGTLRYREVNGSNPTPKANYSYIDMYMRTGSSSYEWVNIVTNNW